MSTKTCVTGNNLIPHKALIITIVWVHISILIPVPLTLPHIPCDLLHHRPYPQGTEATQVTLRLLQHKHTQCEVTGLQTYTVRGYGSESQTVRASVSAPVSGVSQSCNRKSSELNMGNWDMFKHQWVLWSTLSASGIFPVNAVIIVCKQVMFLPFLRSPGGIIQIFQTVNVIIGCTRLIMFLPILGGPYTSTHSF